MVVGLEVMRSKGFEIESYVAKYLEAQGICIVMRNFSCKLGEIDLICIDKRQHQYHEPSEILVFIEVRYRKNTAFGTAPESVTYSKQLKLIRTAEFYLLKHPRWQCLPCRFDIVGVSPKNSQLSIEWIEDAFQK